MSALTRLLLCTTLCLTLTPNLIATERSVLIVGIGGWASCRQGIQNQYIAKQVYHLVNELRSSYPQRRIAYLITCSPGLRAAKYNSPLEYFGPQGHGSYPQNQIHQMIIAAKPEQNSEVYIIGHSHGGGTAMHAVANLGTADGLYTLEPISPQQCDVVDFLHNRSRKILKRRQQYVAGCRQAPTDVSWDRINQAVGGNWSNVILDPRYDRGDLYSSSISVAQNVMIPVIGNDDYIAHHLLGLHQTTWTHLCRSIANKLGANVKSSQCSGIQVNGEGY